jgi:hypothetical protein
MGANAPIFFLANVYNPARLGEHFKYTLFFILPHLGVGDNKKLQKSYPKVFHWSITTTQLSIETRSTTKMNSACACHD